jgi:hypothetical protein
MMGWSATEGRWLGFLGAVMVLVVLAAVVRHHRRKNRRRQSLRRDSDRSSVWFGLDGSPGRSRNDPTGKRDAEGGSDRGGDGGGD